MSVFDLGWGESVCVRQAFINNIKQDLIFFTKEDLNGMGYPKHEGNEELISITREVIKRQTGLEYKYVYLTNGATGGITNALRSLKFLGVKRCSVPNPPHFSLYKEIVQSAGLEFVNYVKDEIDLVYLLDSPSNPEGTVKLEKLGKYTVWDAPYHNRVYLDEKHYTVNGQSNIPDHLIMVGSYSKLIGLNGIRVGWVTTNDDFLGAKLVELITGEYLGLSSPSTKLLIDQLKDFNWDSFEKEARYSLNSNKEEWSKLSRFFQYKEVPENGMFYYGFMDKSCKKLFEKANIRLISGKTMGHTDDFGRFNLAQDRQIIKDAVKTVLKIDKRK